MMAADRSVAASFSYKFNMDFSVLKEHPPLGPRLRRTPPLSENDGLRAGSLWPCRPNGSLTSRTGRLSLQVNHGRAIYPEHFMKIFQYRDVDK
jgi:hypothetical protein